MEPPVLFDHSHFCFSAEPPSRGPVEFSPSSRVPAIPVFRKRGLESGELDPEKHGNENESLLDCLHGLGRGLCLPLWWAFAATIPIGLMSWWLAYRSDWF
jgi:hypothetical protein